MKPLKVGRSVFQVTKVGELVYLLVGPKGGRYYAREDAHNEGLLLVRGSRSGRPASPFYTLRFQVRGDELKIVHAPRVVPWRKKRVIEAEGGSHGEGQGQKEDHQEEDQQ